MIPVWIEVILRFATPLQRCTMTWLPKMTANEGENAQEYCERVQTAMSKVKVKTSRGMHNLEIKEGTIQGHWEVCEKLYGFLFD